MVNSAGTVPLEIIVSKNSCCTDKLSSMLKTNETTTSHNYDSTINENKEIEIPIACTEQQLLDTESVDVETVTTDDSNLDDVTTGNAYSRGDVEVYEVYEEDQEVSYMIPVPKTGKPRDMSLTPITIMLIGKYARFLTSHTSYTTLRTPTYLYEKKYDSLVKIDDM